MCGVVGMFSRRGAAKSRAVAAAVTAMHHRGPDEQGVWSSPGGDVALGHARLSIIDLSGGKQPISNEDDSIFVVVNGELYDHAAIRTSLERDGHRFKTRSDSEIVLHLYERHGADLFRFLRGEFAFVLWDSRNRLFLAARDRFGIKPLFYAWVGDDLFVASEAKALFAAGVPARWSADRVVQSLHAPLNADSTLFDGIMQVLPGHFLLVSDSTARSIRYWDFEYAAEADEAIGVSEQAWCERLRHHLDDAVRLRLQADVPVAVYLSGGLDSSVVLGLAARHMARPPDVFTITFGDPEFEDHSHYNESMIAEESARRLGARFHPVHLSPADLVDHFAPAVRQSETWHWNAHGAAKFALSKAVRDAGFKVVLTGEGADEILFGYSWFQLDQLQPDIGMSPMKMAQMFEILFGLSAAEPERHCAATQQLVRSVRDALGYVPWFLNNEAWIGVMNQRVLDRQFAAGSGDPYRAFLAALDWSQLAKRGRARTSAYLWGKSNFPNYILNVLADRMEMANSVEGRVPFLDHPLVEALRQAPMSVFFKGQVEKLLLREATRDLVTDTVYRRRKFPFVAPPPKAGAKDRFSEMIADLLRGDNLKSLPFFDAKAVRALVDEQRRRSVEKGRAFGVGRLLTQIASACVLQAAYRPSV
jgi:asparagine synthase (glutamine-hydrolysing)